MTHLAQQVLILTTTGGKEVAVPCCKVAQFEPTKEGGTKIQIDGAPALKVVESFYDLAHILESFWVESHKFDGSFRL